MKNITLRQEEPGDYAAIYSLNKQAFQRNDESELINKLRASLEYIPELALVAEKEDGEIIGHILFTRIVIEGETDFPSLALAPMAVLPAYQKSGVGTLMVKQGLGKAKKLGYSSVVVLGHKDYYPHFGFKRASEWGIRCPFEVPDEAFMAIELKDNALMNRSGVVIYSPAFNI